MRTLGPQVRAVMVDKLGISEGDLDDETTLASLDVDSLSLIELTLALQQEFGVTLEDNDLSGDLTVAEVTALVADHPAIEGTS
jgi:acyl carrier protein